MASGGNPTPGADAALRAWIAQQAANIRTTYAAAFPAEPAGIVVPAAGRGRWVMGIAGPAGGKQSLTFNGMILEPGTDLRETGGKRHLRDVADATPFIEALQDGRIQQALDKAMPSPDAGAAAIAQKYDIDL